MFSSLFNNYEIIKLDIKEPNQTNAMIIIALVFFCAITSKKSKTSPSFLSPLQTDQLRGLSIILVILGHLWVHVSNQKPLLIFSGEAVAIFLLLSGFGLTRSEKKGQTNPKTFLYRRLKRIYIPYWWATFFILTADYFGSSG